MPYSFSAKRYSYSKLPNLAELIINRKILSADRLIVEYDYRDAEYEYELGELRVRGITYNSSSDRNTVSVWWSNSTYLPAAEPSGLRSHTTSEQAGLEFCRAEIDYPILGGNTIDQIRFFGGFLTPNRIAVKCPSQFSITRSSTCIDCQSSTSPRRITLVKASREPIGISAINGFARLNPFR